MHSPIHSIASNLRWTRTGTVWADFLLRPLPYGFRPTKDKSVVRSYHQALLRALPGESLLLGVCASLDPAAVVDRMITNVDLDACPDWAAECEATLHTLDQIGPGERIFWLSVPLGNASPSDRLRAPVRAAAANLRDALALPRAGQPTKEISSRLEQADKIMAGIPAPFRPQPATPAQMLWLHLHSQQRGLFLDLDLPQPTSDSTEAVLMTAAGGGLPEPLLDEGGQTDQDRRTLRTLNPLANRFLKVGQPGAPTLAPASYQALLVLSDVPSEGMLFPGSEFVGRIDESGLEIDWAMRLHVRSSAEVSKANRRALINLNDQYGQREGEMSHGLNTLDRAAADLTEYAAVLESDKLEVEVQATTVFCVAGPNGEIALAQARALADYLGGAGYKVTQPVGEQESLWWAMQPGVPTSPVVRQFAQIATSRGLAATVPLASSALGDSTGSLLALNISTGRTGVVLHDIAGASARDVSGSLAIAGELGSGKSLTLKKLAGDVVDRGGRIIAADRTQMGEYAHWATSVTDAVVIDINRPEFSMDPLRIFPASDGGRIAQSFLTPLLNIPPMSEQGVLLSEVTDPNYLEQHGLTSLGALRAHLEGGGLPGSTELARRMNVFARRDFGQAIFNENLPAPPEAPAIIVRTHTLALPTRDELQHRHLFEQLKLEKMFGRAMYALVAALARGICFQDRSTLGAFIVDEAHHVTASPEGENELIEFVRDGRKHTAAVAMGSHDPEADFGSPTLRGLIPTRILMRHRDKTLAKRGLAWLDLDPDDDELVAMLVEETSPVGPQGVPEARRGEAFMRDSSGNAGRIKVLPPSLPARNKAVRTSPPELNTKSGHAA
ncbi:ATP-binding protein [Klenkia sp. PcliD-1-E]|uniref:ATP-binding protein n=1 Tax=Klenkia sp. PcliD-1-E TaxID=2954492 RepID=UPI0020976F4A|nr:ATP-binding protein [Klenkia sp. PcliD-1-E]MCO7219525.1 ATP-binding protein [Klenkia sp. PcliD-1-E]